MSTIKKIMVMMKNTKKKKVDIMMSTIKKIVDMMKSAIKKIMNKLKDKTIRILNTIKYGQKAFIIPLIFMIIILVTKIQIKCLIYLKK